MDTADLLVIGGGIVGLTTALEWKRRYPGERVVLLEKEDGVGRHASGRNSGVLHAGLYYAPDSLKSRFAREGNARMTRYCLERGLPIVTNGKLLVAHGEEEQAALDTLLGRARAAGVAVEEVDEATARELEPAARVRDRALFSPSTASVDPGAVMAALAEDARAAGVELRLGEAFDGVPGGRERQEGPVEVRTSRGEWSAGYVLNAAGVHAARVARQFGAGEGYRIVPFMGRYLRAVAPVAARLHIYPVPDLRYPFLGVHVTVIADGGVWLGPTATPVLGGEQYRPLDTTPREAVATAARLALLLSRPHNTGLRRLAVKELRLRSRRALVREGSRLARGLPPAAGWKPGRPGIRAQLVDTVRWKLQDDFVYEAGEASCHVLNAVSPAFTCALPLSEYLVDTMSGVRKQ